MPRPLDSPRAVRETLEELGIRPRGRWGQHFLVDPNLAEKIVRSVELEPDETALEIGPGLGALTDRLRERAGRVIAVEIDPTLAQWLAERYAGHAHVRILEADAVAIAWDGILPADPTTVAVGNLPYQITSPLVERLIAHRDRVRRAVWMVQREVAAKLDAAPGTREASALGVLTQAFCEVDRLFGVPPQAFSPRPEVASTVIRLRPRAEPAFEAPEAAFRATVRAAFGARRKTLRRALAIGLAVPPTRAGEVLQRAGIDARRRGETLTLDEFDALAHEAWRRGIGTDEA